MAMTDDDQAQGVFAEKRRIYRVRHDLVDDGFTVPLAEWKANYGVLNTDIDTPESAVEDALEKHGFEATDRNEVDGHETRFVRYHVTDTADLDGDGDV